MKCPSCGSLMKCFSAINPIPGQFGRNRMDLHCAFEWLNDFGRLCRGCDNACHMGVITEDPKVWQCHEYIFSFLYRDKVYWLSSHDQRVDPYHQSRPDGVETSLRVPGMTSAILSLPYFIPLSTGDDMDQRAWELFHRLLKLSTFW
jgi:hypothetical protein